MLKWTLAALVGRQVKLGSARADDPYVSQLNVKFTTNLDDLAHDYTAFAINHSQIMYNVSTFDSVAQHSCNFARLHSL